MKSLSFICVLLFCFFLPLQEKNAVAHFQGETKDIYLITWRGFEEGAEGFTEYLDSRGMNYNLIWRDANRDASKLSGYVDEIKRVKPDLVVTWGTTVSVGVLGTYDNVDPSKHITDIPAVFMFPINPLRSKLVPNYESSGRNITGVRYTLSEDRQLQIALVGLKFKKLGIVTNLDEENVRNSIVAMQKAAEEKNIELIIEEIDNSGSEEDIKNNIIKGLEQIKSKGVDILWSPSSSILNIHTEYFTTNALEMGIPVFSSGQNPVKSGKAVMGMGVSYTQTGRRAAVLAEKILRGESTPEELSINEPAEYSIVVNMSVVQQLGLTIPRQLLSIAEIVQN